MPGGRIATGGSYADEDSTTPPPVIGSVTPASNRQVLEALYDTTDGPNWNQSYNWKIAEELRQWHGVIAHDDRVLQLDPQHNYLSGPVPAELGNLTHLRTLRLENNELSGTLLSSLTNLSRLDEFTFHENAGLSAPADERHSSMAPPSRTDPDKVQLFNSGQEPNPPQETRTSSL